MVTNSVGLERLEKKKRFQKYKTYQKRQEKYGGKRHALKGDKFKSQSVKIAQRSISQMPNDQLRHVLLGPVYMEVGDPR